MTEVVNMHRIAKLAASAWKRYGRLVHCGLDSADHPVAATRVIIVGVAARKAYNITLRMRLRYHLSDNLRLAVEILRRIRIRFIDQTFRAVAILGLRNVLNAIDRPEHFARRKLEPRNVRPSKDLRQMARSLHVDLIA